MTLCPDSIQLTVPPPVRVLAITLYWMSEAPELVTVEQWNGQSFEPALVCNVMAGCLEPHSSNVCIPCNLEGMEVCNRTVIRTVS